MDENTENYQQIPQQQHNSQEGTSNSPKLFLFAILMVVIIVALAFGSYFYMNNGGGGSIEGRWDLQSANIINDDGSIDQEASDYYGVNAYGGRWMEFMANGTLLTGDEDGIDVTLHDGRWQVNGNILTLTTSSESLTYTYSISGDALTLETEVYWGRTLRMVLIRA